MEVKMIQKRKQYNQQFKFKVALEAARGVKTVNQIASENSLHPNQVSQWKKQLLAEGPALFNGQQARQQQQQAAQEAELYEQIGRLKMELEWLKKKAATFS
jgi:transposase-like protein